MFPEAIFAVHLDHGDEETCYDCIKSGFYSSVMIDASHESFDENISVSFESDESILYVVGDEHLLKQLLLNLAVNACEAFDGAGGRLVFRLRLNAATGRVSLRVEDNGPGIASDVLKKIYQPFFSTKKQGTGLGLAVSHSIAKSFGGDITVTSEAGKGTTFNVRLPAHES